MTAPEPIPPCPVCKRRPREWQYHNERGKPTGWCIACEPYTLVEVPEHLKAMVATGDGVCVRRAE